MNKKAWKKISIVLIIILIDQGVKKYIYNQYGMAKTIFQGSKVVIPNLVKITYIENTGAAWGLFDLRMLLIILNIAIVLALIKILCDKKYKFDNLTTVGMLLVLSGGIRQFN